MNAQKPLVSAENRRWLYILITQSLCVATVILTVLILKFLSPTTFKAAKDWYNTNILNDTNVNEVLLTDGEADEI